MINLDVNLFFRCFKKGRNTVDLEQTIHHVLIRWWQSMLVRRCCSYCLRLLIDEEFKDRSWNNSKQGVELVFENICWPPTISQTVEFFLVSALFPPCLPPCFSLPHLWGFGFSRIRVFPNLKITMCFSCELGFVCHPYVQTFGVFPSSSREEKH